MKRPVIGIVTTWFERGAAHVSRAYRDVLSGSFDVQIYARGGERYAKGDPHWDGPDIWWELPGEGRSATEIDRGDFERWLRGRRIELVVFNEQQWWPPVLWARAQGVRTVAYVDHYTPANVRWFGIYDALWCNTRRHYSVFQGYPGACYLPWGTDVELFQPQDEIWTEEIVFFHSAGMGGANLRKGTDLLIEAFQQVRGPARLVIHSQVPASVYGTAAALLAQDPRIEFIEGTAAAPGLYDRGDVYVYPARLDGIGLTMAEALACGLPVIATDVPPCSEFVIPGRSGWLVPVARSRRREDDYYWPETECDTDALAAIMQRCVDERDQRSQWRRQARGYAEEHLDWRKNSQGLAAEVHRLLAAPPRRVSRRLRREILAAYPGRISLARRLQRRARYHLAPLRARLKAREHVAE
jgi:glycosyltransferase involved in cell wall biosynthesis